MSESQLALYRYHQAKMVEKSNLRKLAKQAKEEATIARVVEGAKSLMELPNKRRASGPPTKVSASIPPRSSPSDLSSFSVSQSQKTVDWSLMKHVKGSGIQTLITNPKPSIQAVKEMDCALTEFVVAGGRSFNMIEDPNLALILKLAKSLPSNYKPPNRRKLAGVFLPKLFQDRYKKQQSLLMLDMDVFGLTFYLDGATVHKMALYNFMGAGAHIPNATLEIHDFSDHMAKGKTKDAASIAKILEAHITKIDASHECTDLVIIDGASNVQKVGRVINSKYPRITAIHGAEHVVALFFSGVAKTEFGSRGGATQSSPHRRSTRSQE